MKTWKKAALAAMVFSGLMVAGALHTSAYLDPSIITYIISVAAGLVVAGGAGVALYWKRIKLFFKKRKEQKPQNQMNAAAGQNPAPKNGEEAPAPQNENLAD